MGNFLFSAFAFLFALGMLITIHEFGHYWVARRSGVKVLRFSVGFGRPLFRKVAGTDKTEYVLAAVPLGGYVKMLDEREGEVAEAELHRAFNRQSLPVRSAIVFAGPFFNFLFAIVAYWLMFGIGLPGMKALVGEVTPDSLAYQAGLRQGDEIVAIGEHETPTWHAVRQTLLTRMFDGGALVLDVVQPDGDRKSVSISLGDDFFSRVEEGRIMETLGIAPYMPAIPPVIGDVLEGSVAQKAGLRSGDRVLQAAGKPIEDWVELVDIIQLHPDRDVAMVIERKGEQLTLQLVPESVQSGDRQIGRIGATHEPLGPMPDELKAVLRYSPIEGLGQAVVKTWDMSVLTLRMMGKMLIGEVSLDNLSGPITIAKYAGYTAGIGIATFLSFLAIVSVSLGVLNLLPIPVLDGGHLMLYGIEWVKGGPLSEKFQLKLQQVGLVILLALMSIALFNDFARILN